MTTSRALKSVIFACGTALSAASIANSAVIFVNASQNLPLNQQSGASWPLAFQSLQSALTASHPNDQIWVAQGTYKPTDGTDRTISFLLTPSVSIYGGFQVGAASLAEQNPTAFPTILSGDIGAPNNNVDNSFHVVQVIVNKDVIFDGLTVTGGNANGAASSDRVGANLNISGSDILVRHCRIVSGNALGSGAGVFANFDNASNSKPARFLACDFIGNVGDNGCGLGLEHGNPKITCCRFLGNSGVGQGAGLRILNCPSAIVEDCVFSGNNAGSSGGAILVSASTAAIHFCSFANNTVAFFGGAGVGVFSSANVLLSNSVFFSNSGSTNGDILNSGGTLTIQGCAVPTTIPAGVGNFVVVDPFIDANGFDDATGTEDDNLRLRQDSNCIDHGVSANFPTDALDADADGNVAELLPVDADGGGRAVDDVRANTGTGALAFVDVGAYEFAEPYRVICVDQNASGDKTGVDWPNAMLDLQEALSAASQRFEQPVEVWVADGTYKPTDGTDRNASFRPPAGIAMYGGFASTEFTRADRRPLLHATILSGEIGNRTIADNSFHVLDLTNDSMLPNTIIDGFVITRGNAIDFGGGVRLLASASPTIRSCRIVGNQGSDGAGLGMAGPGTAPIIHNCFFSGNSADGIGGGVAVFGASSTSQLVSCTIVGNSASKGGGVGLSEGCSIGIGDSILFFNKDENGDSDDTSQVYMDGSASATIRNCCIPCKGAGIGASDTIGVDPQFVNAAGADATFGTVDDNPALSPFSPCIDAGQFAIFGGYPIDIGDSDDNAIGGPDAAYPHDLAILPRVHQDAGMPDFSSPPIDLGALEFQTDSVGNHPLLGDLDGDGHVNGSDLAIALGAWGTTGPTGDLNGDCVIDGADLALMLGGWTP